MGPWARHARRMEYRYTLHSATPASRKHRVAEETEPAGRRLSLFHVEREWRVKGHGTVLLGTRRGRWLGLSWWRCEGKGVAGRFPSNRAFLRESTGKMLTEDGGGRRTGQELGWSTPSPPPKSRAVCSPPLTLCSPDPKCDARGNGARGLCD